MNIYIAHTNILSLYNYLTSSTLRLVGTLVRIKSNDNKVQKHILIIPM